MSSSTPAPSPGYLFLLARREFLALHLGFTCLALAATVAGFALGSLVHAATGDPLLTSVAMFGSPFATVVGALTLMSVADGARPRRTLLRLQTLTLVAFAAQAWPDLPLPARFALLLAVGFGQSLSTGVRMGILVECVPREQYALARSLMNITAGGVQVVGYAVGAALLVVLSPTGLFVVAAALVALALTASALGLRERSVRLTRRPGPAATWRTNRRLFARRGVRALLVTLWVPNGLVVGCESLLLSYDASAAGVMLAAGSAGMLLGDLVVGRVLDVQRRRAWAYGLRLLLAAPLVGFALQPPTAVCCLLLFVASTGFAATLPLQERLIDLTPDSVRGQVQGVESAGRMTWQGLGAVLGGGLASLLTPAVAIAALAATSLAITVATRRAVERSRPIAEPREHEADHALG